MDKVISWESNSSFSSRTIHGFLVRKLGMGIVSGEYPPGVIMPNEAELLKENGVSRTAMREAIKILTAKGLLESRPRVGLRVRAARDWNLLDPDVLGWYCEVGGFSSIAAKVMQMRQMFEPFAAAQAAVQRTDAQLENLTHCYQRMANATNLDDWTTSDLAFHEAILAATGNELLIPLGNMIREGLRTIFTLSEHDVGDKLITLSLHKEVLDAISAKNAAQAHATMLKILARSSATIDDGAESEAESEAA
jgi:DNA-binding FadR family transcriptional regulator